MIEDIKGYKPHTEEKISKVNSIKEAEAALGKIYKELDEELGKEWNIILALPIELEETAEKLNENCKKRQYLNTAIDRLKESSMWACRAVFNPEETY